MQCEGFSWRIGTLCCLAMLSMNLMAEIGDAETLANDAS